MRIAEYNDVDPLGVLHLTMLALDYPLTPELVAHIRRTDPRPFPELAVYAVEGDQVLGQVGVFRLPMISIEGREDVGGVWAVSTHPEYAGQGIASRLLDEAHARMRAVGLRFSTLGTNRYRLAYKLYRQHGYADMGVWGTALARWDTAHQPTRLKARLAVADGFDFVEELFENIAAQYLGFSWRHMPFRALREGVSLDDVWILFQDGAPTGFALTQKNESILKINNMLLGSEIDAAEAIAAVIAGLKTAYIQVTTSRPAEIASLQRAGYQVAHPNWSAFMVKPLTPDVTIADARRLFGIGTDRFLISWLDTT